MLKNDITSVKEMLLTVTNQASAEGSGIIRQACRNLESIADQVGCLEAHFIPTPQEIQQEETVAC